MIALFLYVYVEAVCTSHDHLCPALGWRDSEPGQV